MPKTIRRLRVVVSSDGGEAPSANHPAIAIAAPAPIQNDSPVMRYATAPTRDPRTAMATAIVSVLTGIPVRKDVAMTGEITLRGRVLPIGGLKEKTLAAHRAGIKRVIVPERNKADLEEVPKEVRDELEFVFVHKLDEGLEAALEKMPQPSQAYLDSVANAETQPSTN